MDHLLDNLSALVMVVPTILAGIGLVLFLGWSALRGFAFVVRKVLR